MSLWASVIETLVKFGCCAVITWIFVRIGWPPTDALLGAVIFALCISDRAAR